MRFFLLISVVSVSTSIARPLSQSFINQNGEITQNDFTSLNDDVTQDRVDSGFKIAAKQGGRKSLT